MATIAGSQFIATAPGQPVDVAFTAPGSPPQPAAAAFNLEVFVGAGAAAPAMAPSYQGFAVLSPSGLELDLVGGAFAVTDDGAGNDTIAAFGAHETVTGGTADVTLVLNGDNDVANGGGGLNTITVNGNDDTVNGGRNDQVNVYGTGAVINGGTDGDTINVYSTGDTINGGPGPDTINVYSGGDIVNAGYGPDTITASDDTINAVMGPDTIDVTGSNDLVNMGPDSNSARIAGANDTVTAGTLNGGVEQDLVTFVGGDMNFADAGGTEVYADTVVGFSQSAGDTIALTGANGGAAGISAAVNNQQSQNGGQDTIITLNNGSTILLKGVAHVDSSFFS